MFGSNPVIGVKPATEYQFRIFTTPVGPYFKGGAKPITIRVSDVDRAAPHGTGDIKAGLLILDDLGTEFNSSFFLTNLYSLLNNRWRRKASKERCLKDSYTIRNHLSSFFGITYYSCNAKILTCTKILYRLWR